MYTTTTLRIVLRKAISASSTFALTIWLLTALLSLLISTLIAAFLTRSAYASLSFTQQSLTYLYKTEL
jgi:hypothetical protein